MPAKMPSIVYFIGILRKLKIVCINESSFKLLETNCLQMIIIGDLKSYKSVQKCSLLK